MKEHRCTKFKQVGQMQFLAANLSISVNGRRRESSASADTVHLKCMGCGQTRWVNRADVIQMGKHLAVKVIPELKP